ncbi:MAG: ATP-binding protein [Pseudomonadota bacterium]
MQFQTKTYVTFSVLLVVACLVVSGLGAPIAFGLVGLPLMLLVFWFAFASPEDVHRLSPSAPASADDPLGATQSWDRGELPAGFGQTLLRQMPAPLLLINGAGRLVYANPAAEDILPGYQPGVPYTTLIRTPAFVEAVSATLATGEDRSIAFATLQPRERFLEARVSRLPPGGGFGDFTLVIVQLEDRTQDRLAMQTRSDFIANASHELRTPLASILGFIETLQGHAKDDPDVQEKFLGIMYAQASRMKRLVNDLMSLSKIEMTAHVPPEEQIAINSVAREAASALLPQAKQSDVRLIIDLPPEDQPLYLVADRDQIAQVILNLVDNAIKYAGAGKTVRLFLADPDPSYPGQIGLTVSDDGPGIAREHLPRLTERFYRVNSEKSTDKSGTGLGLAIIKHILNRHEGALDIQSTQGDGARFTIWLPAARFGQERAEPAARAAE